MILDLRFQGRLEGKILNDFEEVSLNSRIEFNNFVSFYSKLNIENIYWWVSSPASRNTYASSLFHNFCVIKLILDCPEERFVNLNEIWVSSKEIKKVLEEVLRRRKFPNIKVVFKKGFSIHLEQFYRRFISFKYVFFKRCLRLLFTKILSLLIKKKIPNFPIVLLDTFITKHFVENDRWYGVLWDRLSDQQRQLIYFAPTIINTNILNYIPLIISFKKSKKNFLHKEDFLKFKDILFAYKYETEILNLNFQRFDFCDINLENLVKEELSLNRDNESLYEALLTYKFIQRISERGIKIKVSYDWFEGQSIDKSWNLGMSIFYKRSTNIAYRAFFNGYPFYLSTYPIEIEKKAGVVPSKFAIQGEGSSKDLRSFLKDIQINIIPAFKADYISNWNLSENKQKNILVTLPISKEFSKKLLENLFEISQEKNLEQIKFLIKSHPTVQMSKILNKIQKKPPDNFIFTDEKSFPCLLKEARVLITEASSTALESLACGIPVIIVKNFSGITYDPIPGDIPQEILRKVSTRDQIIHSLNYYLNITKKDLETIFLFAKEIRKSFFMPVTSEGIELFLNGENNHE